MPHIRSEFTRSFTIVKYYIDINKRTGDPEKSVVKKVADIK